MKKITILVLLVFAFSLVPAHFAVANDNDLQAIKKAVKENPKVKPGQEVKWFKVLITDTKTDKAKVRITLPISLIELILDAEHDRFDIDRDEYDVDIKEIFAELKKAGPMAIIEVYEDDEIIKVWFE
ncbi:MAG: hypothetical protein GF421_00700 [Candidatus Aminicenantes bacterium]|nr:hypothetical protein [Candidatus Aminicenantes bacterium]